MKSLTRFLFAGFLIFISACNNSEKDNLSENDIDAARNFIRASLDGKFDEARKYLLSDSANNQFLDVHERNYKERMSLEDKSGYRMASINVHELRTVNDSTSLVFYSNSYFKKDTHHLKVVKVDNLWLVDFKSYFEPVNDSLP